MWLGLTRPRGVEDCGFLYYIEVDGEHRSAGSGRALLAAGERELRDRGVGSLELSVFGDNGTAIRLYQTSGYRVVTRQMRKALGPGKP